MYLIIVDYLDDTERKRMEYLFERNKDVVERPNGAVAIIKNDNPDEIVKELISKLSEERVKIYKLEEYEFEQEKERKNINMEFDTDVNAVDKFLSFLMAKRKAILKTETEGVKTYNIYTRKGKADIMVKLSSREKRTMLSIRIEAFEPALSYLYDEIKGELEFFKGGV